MAAAVEQKGGQGTTAAGRLGVYTARPLFRRRGSE
jgi:hypothetical protein